MSEARLRRPNFTEQERQSWREKEAQGIRRSQIAKEAGVDPSVITRQLGAKRKYKKAEPEIVS